MKKLSAFLALAGAFCAFAASAQTSFNQTNLPSGNGPAFVLAVDINGNGHPGLVAANFGFRFGNTFGFGGGSGSTLSVFTNDGLGNLYSNATLTVGSEPAGIAAADLTGDGALDLISANVGDNTLTVLTNNHHGGFKLSATYKVGQAPAFVTAADVNGDGKSDLISANFGDASITVLTNDGHGGFNLSAILPAGTQPNCIAAADIYGNGKLDLICANSGDSTIQIYTNTGQGTFASVATNLISSGVGWVIGTDVDGNGSVDLVTGGPTVTVLTNDGAGNFGLKSSTVSAGAGMVVAADMNGDGKVDLVTPNNGNGVQGFATVLTNDGVGNFTAVTQVSIGLTNFVNYPNCVTVADFNGDGNLDFAIDCYASTNYSTTARSTLTALTQTSVTAKPAVAMSSPAGDSVIQFNSGFELNATATSVNPIEVVVYYLDNVPFRVSTSAPFSWAIPGGTVSIGSHALQAEAVDGKGHIGWSPEIQFNVTSTNLPSTTGLLLWLDSSYANTVKTNATGGVTNWLNLAPGATNAVGFSGRNDNDTSPSYNTGPPTYIPQAGGKMVLNFNGSGYLDNLNFSSETPASLTVFLLAAPLANPGNYPAFLSFNQSHSTDDFTTGINIDLGNNSSTDFDQLNVEGAKKGGGGGFQFLSSPMPFGLFHVIEIDDGGGTADANSLVSAYVDGVFQSSLQGAASTLSLSNCYIGSRCFTSGSANHDFIGQIAAVLVYDHQLAGADLAQTRAYLNTLTGGSTIVPVVNITAPANNASVLTSQSFVISATASSTITAMEFFSDGQLLGTATSSPYSFTVAGGTIAAGIHSLQAVAVHGLGATTASPAVNLIVNTPGTKLIDFDALNTTSGAVGGATLVSYLAQYGVSVAKLTVGTALEAVNTNSSSANVQVTASSAPNFFTQAGLTQPVSFTLNFSTPLQSFGFTRAGVTATSGLASHPHWTATIFDAGGNALGSVSEGLQQSSQPIAARTFVLTGANIASVRFDSDAQGIAAFPAVLLDDLFLNANATAPQLSAALNVLSPPVNNIIAPATLVLGVSVADQISASYSVSYYAGATLLGTAAQSPYQISVPNLLPGTYSLQARVTDAGGVSAYSAVVPVTVQIPANSAELTFDQLNTSRGFVTGAALNSYLAGFGVTVSGLSQGTALTVENQVQIAGGSAALAASAPNLLTQTGSSGPVQFTLNFAPFLTQFGFTRPALLANPFVSHPAWQVTAFDAAGNVVGQAGEAQIDSTTNVGAAEFSLSATGGAGIAHVEFASQGTGLTTFNAMLLDNLVLTTNKSAFPPAVAITSPISGLSLAAPPSVTITAAASGAVGIASVSFYTNGVLLGMDTGSPYSIQWLNPPVGNYVLTAVASNTLGLLSTSVPVNVAILSSASLFGIATSPASQTVAAGGSVTFSVTTTGTSPVTYQWSHGKTPISGATSATLILPPPLNDGDAGDYSVAVTSQGQTLVSAPAVLIIVDPPTITTQPAAQTLAPGSTLVLTVAATGGGTLTYQWLLNHTAIPGANGSTYFISSAEPLNSGNYQVVVANQAASALSAVAPVIIQTAITIPATNNSFAARVAINPLLGPVAATDQPFPLQPGTPLPDGLPGGNSIWFTWTPDYTGTVSLTTEGSDFDTIMAIYTGTALNNLKVIAADDDSGGFLTSLVSFNVTKGTPYQIAVDGFEGASGRVVLGLPAANGQRLLSPASGTVPIIVKSPVSQTVAPNSKVTLTVQATSATKPSYQWFFQNIPIPNGTNSTLTIPQLRPALVGLYDVLVANAIGSAQSEPANIQLGLNSVGKPSSAENKFLNTTQKPSPASLAVDITPLAAGGDTRGFSVSQVFSTVGAASEPNEPEPCGQVGTASQWFVYTAPAAGMFELNLEGSTFNTVVGIYTGPGNSFTNLVEAGCGYVTNYFVQGQPSVVLPSVAKGTTFYILVAGYQGASGVAQLQIGLGAPLLFTELPASQIVTAGSNATFAVATTGSIPSSYQWQLNGANVTGATKQTYKITGVQAAAGGNYTVAVSNVLGGVTSSPPAALTVQFAPYVLTGPAGLTVTQGQTAKFAVTAAGVNVKTNHMVAHWYFSGAPLAKDTNLILTIPNANSANGGSYYLILSNSYGMATSGLVTLTVQQKVPPGVTGSFPVVGGGPNPPGGNGAQQDRATAWLSSSAGTYRGLFFPACLPSTAKSGFFTATIASGGGGAFSANLLIDGTNYPFAGQFDASGRAVAVVPRAGKPDATASLVVDTSADGVEMAGLISSADGLSLLKAARVSRNYLPNAASLFTLTPTNEDNYLPGTLAITNTAPGTVLVTGNLPDGTAIVAFAPVVEPFAVPVYVPLYSGKGSFSGWINLTNSPAGTNYGQATWVVPGRSNAVSLGIVK